jgi:hypothetical protein
MHAYLALYLCVRSRLHWEEDRIFDFFNLLFDLVLDWIGLIWVGLRMRLGWVGLGLALLAAKLGGIAALISIPLLSFEIGWMCVRVL